MRISDWSSDVCSSDLSDARRHGAVRDAGLRDPSPHVRVGGWRVSADNSRRPREGGGRRRFTRRRRNKPPAAPAFAGATSYAISAPHPKTAARDHHRLVPSCLNLATRSEEHTLNPSPNAQTICRRLLEKNKP